MSKEGRGTAFDRAGLSLGSYGSPTKADIQRLRDAGYFATRMTVTLLRGGYISGEKIGSVLLVKSALERGTAPNKDILNSAIAHTGISLREKSKRIGIRYSSNGLTNAISQKLGLGYKVVQRHMRAMRAEAVYSQYAGNIHPETEEKLFSSAKKFIEERERQDIKESWEFTTVSGFYNQLYSTVGGRGVRAWVPHEFEFLADYYDRRIANGSTLSAFDLISLESFKEGVDSQLRAVSILREQTGIPIDDIVLYDQVNAIIDPLPSKLVA